MISVAQKVAENYNIMLVIFKQEYAFDVAVA